MRSEYHQKKQRQKLCQPGSPPVPRNNDGQAPRLNRQEALEDIWKINALERSGKLRALPSNGHQRNTTQWPFEAAFIRASKNQAASSNSNKHDQATTDSRGLCSEEGAKRDRVSPSVAPPQHNAEKARNRDPSYPNLTGPAKPEGPP